MKTKRILVVILMVLPLLYTLVALPFLPEQIPAHYNINNQVDRWGSKYEVLIFTAITILFGIVMFIITNIASKQERNEQNNEKIALLTSIFSPLLFNAMSLYFLYTDFHSIDNLNTFINRH